MKRRTRFSRILKWTRWVILTLLLLPIAALILMKLTGSMKMRKSDDQILGELHAYAIEKKIDTMIIGDRQITYLKTSKGDVPKKQAVIFVHGSPGSMDAYLKYMHNDTLLRMADLIAYDRPGYGHSDFGKSLPSLRGQAGILQNLIKHLGYENYWLVGHSYGAPIIMQTAMDYPRSISGIGIIAGSITYEMEPVSAWRKYLDLPFISTLLPYTLRVSNEELISLRRDLRMIDDDWHYIEIPVSLIHGTKDVLVPYQNLELAATKLINADTVRTLVFEDENHFILWTQTEQIVKELLALMRKE